MLIVFVIQIAFYYFDLYELRNLREGIRVAILLLGALGVSSLFLGVVYYSIPSFAFGRGILTISLLNILILAFLWRFIYIRIAKIRIFRERILIVGTGELAKKIIKEISENEQESFEVVGFVSERRGEVGQGIHSIDYRGLQPDSLYHQRGTG
jgi:FlaA1/EpsC-like NDP-sugar epimerase